MRRFVARLAMAACVGLLPGGPARAQVQAQEHEVKAAFLYKFLSFIEWPNGTARADAPLVIGVLGAPDVRAELQRVVPGRPVNGRPVVVRPVRPDEPLAGLQVLFVGRDEAARLPQLARQAQPGLVVVSEAPGALEQGSVINFVVSDGRVRFEVALDNAERSRVRISSRMLSVAQYVRGGGRP